MKLIRVNSRHRQQANAVSRNQKNYVNNKNLQKKKHLCYEIIYINKYGIRNIGLVCIILVASLSAALVLINQRKQDEDEEYDYEYQETHYGDHLGNHKVYYREDWKGTPPKNNTKPLEHPATLVIISHSSTFPCNSFENCGSEVKKMQKQHFSEPFFSVDIGYNFVIGGDGDIYVGRGWDIQNFHRINSIGINIIGNFAFDTFNASMIEATEMLVNQGLELNKVAKDYILVGENQTNSKYYLSPGVNVYKVIEKWPNFSNKTIF